MQETGVSIETERLAHKRAEPGDWIGIDYWGKGYATEAAGATLVCGFSVLDLDRIHACDFPRDPNSGRALEKIGMVNGGFPRRHSFKWGEQLDAVLMGILRSEWQALRSVP